MNGRAAAQDQRSVVLGAAGLLILAWVLWQVRSVVILVCFALIFAFALDPLVNLLQKLPLPRGERLPRQGAAAVVVLTLLLLVAWLLSLAVPRLIEELGRFVAGLPANISSLLDHLRTWAAGRGLGRYVEPAIDSARANAAGSIQYVGGLVAGWIGRLFSGIVQVLGLFVLPLLIFYLLAERGAVESSLMAFVPGDAQPRLAAVRLAMYRALRSYVRGQAIVCIIMGTTTGGILALLGFPVALLLGVIVGLAEIVPYLGFMLAAVAIGISGYGVSPGFALLGVGIYIGVNWLIGMLVTPRVMSRYLRLHPFVVTVSILAGAELLGPAGALLALPGAAVIQALVAELGWRRAPAAAEAR